ncbi:hypothetical protein B0A49_05371 [Cryomyces minteri]|uniref:Uncharacterized protein n=1 Tax=Cryomyces minteri TaxID=331657 RepID=A0A4U0X6D0_9PEZI|nr:hypothetical protein B0A49_05371 [Cryomyces minteri]
MASARTFRIFRLPSLTGNSYHPTVPLQFDPPKGSDELFFALMIAYPQGPTHSERMRAAVIDFLMNEKTAEDFAETAAVFDHSKSDSPSYSSQSTFGDSSFLGSLPNSTTSNSPSNENRFTDHQASKAPPTDVGPSVNPTPSLQTMTSVWSVSEKVQPKMRSRRKMTEHEKVEYRQRRVMRACENCSKRKRKCHHNQPDTDAVQATKKASAKKRSKDSAKPTGINTATAPVTPAAFSQSVAFDFPSAFRISDTGSPMSFTDELNFADVQPFDLQYDAFAELGALFPQHDMSVPTWHDTTYSPILPTGYESMSRQSSSSLSELFTNGRSQSPQCSSGSPSMLTRQNTLSDSAGMNEFINHDFVLFDDVNDRRLNGRADARAPAALGIVRPVNNANVVGGEIAAATPSSIHELARDSHPGTIARPSRPPRTLVQNDLHTQVQDSLTDQSFELRATGSTVFPQSRSEQSTNARQNDTSTPLAQYKQSGVASDHFNNAQALAIVAAHGHASVEQASSRGAISSPHASEETRKSGIKALRKGGQGSAGFTVHITKHARQNVSDRELAPEEVIIYNSAATTHYFLETNLDSSKFLEHDDSSPQARVPYSRILGNDLSLLSLNGGGVRVISSVASMKRMMQMTEFAASLIYFSLMASSIGGLIAVMALENANGLAEAASNGALNIRRRFGQLLWPDSPPSNVDTYRATAVDADEISAGRINYYFRLLAACLQFWHLRDQPPETSPATQNAAHRT